MKSTCTILIVILFLWSACYILKTETAVSLDKSDTLKIEDIDTFLLGKQLFPSKADSVS